jgi:cell division protein FtsI (penicillin-binding protein 3)/stage V sporulation protein D (sporulation-specific penicillin-binding protein)
MIKHLRLNLIFFLFILAGAAIISRLIVIQVLKADYYKAMAQGQNVDLKILRGERGKIFFRGGEVLATNIKKDYLFISPRKITDKERTAEILSRLLNLKKDLILEKVKKDNLFEKIKSGLTKTEKEAVEKAVKENKLSGVYFGRETAREYPQAGLASHLVGFLSRDGRGQYGIEGYYNDILQGKEVVLKEGRDREEENRGADIFLTIDYNIQFMAEKLLSRAKKEFDIEGGQIIVAEPGSGRILALADFPNFDPNNYSEVKDYKQFQNSAVQKLFEPGSVFKAITMAAALDQHKITPQTSYFDSGKVKIGGYTIYNYDLRSFGRQTMTNVLEKSINTGAVFAQKRLGNDLFLDYVNRFGFFQPTGIDLQAEIFSENKELKKGYEINFATASFGQGIEVTPIQLIRAFSAIANGGRLVKPYVVEKLLKDGKVVSIKPKISSNPVVSEKTCSRLTAMLVSVVKNGPYTKRAKIPGYYIAGKTGTSQVAWSALGIKKKGYSNKTWQSFIGFAPAFNPKFLVLVKLDNPKTKSSEYSAAPIFREMAKYIIDYKQIPPDYKE